MYILILCFFLCSCCCFCLQIIKNRDLRIWSVTDLVTSLLVVFLSLASRRVPDANTSLMAMWINSRQMELPRTVRTQLYSLAMARCGQTHFAMPRGHVSDVDTCLVNFLCTLLPTICITSVRKRSARFFAKTTPSTVLTPSSICTFKAYVTDARRRPCNKMVPFTSIARFARALPV